MCLLRSTNSASYMKDTRLLLALLHAPGTTADSQTSVLLENVPITAVQKDHISTMKCVRASWHHQVQTLRYLSNFKLRSFRITQLKKIKLMTVLKSQPNFFLRGWKCIETQLNRAAVKANRLRRTAYCSELGVPLYGFGRAQVRKGLQRMFGGKESQQNGH